MISDLSQILIEPYVVSSSIRHLIWVTASWEIIDLCKRLKNEPHSSKNLLVREAMKLRNANLMKWSICNIITFILPSRISFE